MLRETKPLRKRGFLPLLSDFNSLLFPELFSLLVVSLKSLPVRFLQNVSVQRNRNGKKKSTLAENLKVLLFCYQPK